MLSNILSTLQLLLDTYRIAQKFKNIPSFGLSRSMQLILHSADLRRTDAVQLTFSNKKFFNKI